jgi:translation initiation factor eIF-2B subunit beta
MTTPSDVLKYTNELDLENIETVAAEFDYIPPELVDLYVTNIGGHQPSYIYRILADWYHPEDYDLQLPSISHR